MKKLLKLILISLTGFILVSCGSKTDLNKDEQKNIVTLDEFTIHRRKVDLVVSLHDKNKKVSGDSVVLRILLEKTEIEKKVLEFTEKESMSHSFRNLTPDKTYELEISVTTVGKNQKINKHIIITKSFKTSNEGVSEDNPILIKTVQDFMQMGTTDDGKIYYKLDNDLDFLDYDALGTYRHQFGSSSFKGVLDGNNKTIKNVLINSRTTYIGLIPYNAGVIKNLNVENINIHLTEANSYSQYIGIISGKNSGTIENVNITNSNITTSFSYTGKTHIGSVSGHSDANGKIINVYSNATIDVTSTTRSEFYLGGLVGQIEGGELKESSSESDIIIANADTLNAGGVIGHLKDAKVSEVSYKGSIEVTTYVKTVSTGEIIEVSVGGFVGKQVNSTTKDIYVESEITLTNATNIASNQSSSDKVIVGGYAGGILSGSKIENIYVKTVLEVGLPLIEEDESFSGFESIYVGGLSGATSNFTVTKTFVFDPVIKVYQDNGNYYINPGVALAVPNRVINFKQAQIIFNDETYNNKGLTYISEEFTETDLLESLFEGFFPVDSYVYLKILEN